MTNSGLYYHTLSRLESALGERQVSVGLSRMFASFLGCNPPALGHSTVPSNNFFFFFLVFYQEFSIVELCSQPSQCHHCSPAQPLAHQAPVGGERG